MIPEEDDPLDGNEEAEEMKFFMVGGEERLGGGKKWRSSKSSAKSDAERDGGFILSMECSVKVRRPFFFFYGSSPWRVTITNTFIVQLEIMSINQLLEYYLFKNTIYNLFKSIFI